jgi:hypothetical protein
MSGWWRRNALALGAVVILAPALAVTVTWNEWAYYYLSRGTFPVTVQPGDSTRYGEATVGPVTARFVHDPAVPPNARVVSVTIRIDPGRPALECLGPTLRELHGRQREWDQAPIELESRRGETRWTSCDPDATGPYTVTADYLVPLDASGPFAVEVESAASIPSFVSAVVEP